MANVKPRRIASGLSFPEGPAFDANGQLYCVNLASGDISRIREDGSVECFINFGGKANGAAFAANGDLYLCESQMHQIAVVHADRSWETFADQCDGEAFRAPNDMVFDQHGNFYFTDPGGSNPDNPIGTVHFATPDGTVTTVDCGMQFPNGIAMTADGNTLTAVETYPRCIWAYDVVRPGVTGDKRMLWQHENEACLPDGMAYDADGNLWVAAFGVGEIVVVSPAGETLEKYDAGGLKPTNCAFGGPDFSTLYITECETNCIYALETGVQGQKLFPDMV